MSTPQAAVKFNMGATQALAVEATLLITLFLLTKKTHAPRIPRTDINPGAIENLSALKSNHVGGLMLRQGDNCGID